MQPPRRLQGAPIAVAAARQGYRGSTAPGVRAEAGQPPAEDGLSPFGARYSVLAASVSQCTESVPE